MRYQVVKTAEQWAKIEAMGTYEQDFRNGELWEFNGELFYLSHLELSTKELKELTEYNNREDLNLIKQINQNNF